MRPAEVAELQKTAGKVGREQNKTQPSGAGSVLGTSVASGVIRRRRSREESDHRPAAAPVGRTPPPLARCCSAFCCFRRCTPADHSRRSSFQPLLCKVQRIPANIIKSFPRGKSRFLGGIETNTFLNIEKSTTRRSRYLFFFLGKKEHN